VAFRFREFQVYKDAKEFNRSIISATGPLKGTVGHELQSQIRRASISIVLNIAEGSDKGSDKDFNRHLRLALGSLNEVVAGLDIAHDSGMLSESVFSKSIKAAEELALQLGGFSKHLTNK